LCVLEEGDMEDWKAFHDWLYENQPAGPGPANSDFLKAMEDLEVPVERECVLSEKYVPWVAEATKEFNRNGPGQTPAVFVNEERVESSFAAIQAALEGSVGEDIVGEGEAPEPVEPTEAD